MQMNNTCRFWGTLRVLVKLVKLVCRIFRSPTNKIVSLTNFVVLNSLLDPFTQNHINSPNLEHHEGLFNGLNNEMPYFVQMSAESKIVALGINLPDAPKPGGVSFLPWIWGSSICMIFLSS